ncbi:hypothetical protein CEP52_015747 [Fusarium oligoseptatum]|uniref:Uncharacterized protein n=1 Tax=Fusarium oligoseptatum TaxID=2604345 RepID=A0A428SA72_9HYPO|nr:hypothetical protein CEP52_015747 [Fusarium oligoseptatum]
MSDSSVSEMSDSSVSETSDHSDTNISWEDVDEDIRELQTSSLPLSVVNGTGEVLDGPVECPYLWLRDCAGSGASDQYVYLPEEAIVEPQSHRFFEVYVIKLPWLALNAILGQIWNANLDNKPTFQRVIQFYLE